MSEPMAEPTFDDEGYPTDETLDTIRTWPFGDFTGLMRFCAKAWSDYGWFEPHKVRFDDPLESTVTWACATGGWSGNESIIGALQDNFGFWMACWSCHARGGYYEFLVPKGGRS